MLIRCRDILDPSRTSKTVQPMVGSNPQRLCLSLINALGFYAPPLWIRLLHRGFSSLVYDVITADKL